LFHHPERPPYLDLGLFVLTAAVLAALAAEDPRIRVNRVWVDGRLRKDLGKERVHVYPHTVRRALAHLNIAIAGQLKIEALQSSSEHLIVPSP
jgi:hypothetical protein